LHFLAAMEPYMTAKRITVSLKEKDQQAVQAIQARFRLLSQNDAIRFALRVLALPPGQDGAFQKLGLQGVPSPRQSRPSRMEPVQQTKAARVDRGSFKARRDGQSWRQQGFKRRRMANPLRAKG
jgi:hypothetical protein